MGLRFQKRIKILPGLRLNVSKSGISWTVGTRGASVTTREGKLTGNVGLPGTGISHRKRLDFPGSPAKNNQKTSVPKQSGSPSILLLVIVFVLGVLIGMAIG
jgi:hypothetical protein